MTSRIKMVPLASRIVTIARSGDQLTDAIREEIAALKGMYIKPARAFPKETLSVHLAPAKTKHLRPGVHLVVGGTSSGKSTMGKYIVNHNELATRLIFEEPEEDDDVIVDEVNLGVAIAQAVESGKRIIVVDSFRTLGYRASSNTGKGGIDMQLFTWTTVLDLWAKAAGIHVFGIVNPLSVDEELLAQLQSATAGAVQSAIIVAKPSAQISTRSDVDRAWDSFAFRVSARELAAPVVGALPTRESALTGVSLDDRLIDLSFPRLF